MTAEDWKRRSVWRVAISTMYECRMNEKTYLEVLSNFTDKTLEGEFANEKFGRLLVATNFTESDGTRPEAVRLLDTTSYSLWTIDESKPERC